MANDINKAIEWILKWRMDINLEKTEICLFSKRKIDNHNEEIMGNQLKYNPKPKLLGAILDEKMTFRSHIEYTEKRPKQKPECTERH